MGYREMGEMGACVLRVGVGGVQSAQTGCPKVEGAGTGLAGRGSVLS